MMSESEMDDKIIILTYTKKKYPAFWIGGGPLNNQLTSGKWVLKLRGKKYIYKRPMYIDNENKGLVPITKNDIICRYDGLIKNIGDEQHLPDCIIVKDIPKQPLEDNFLLGKGINKIISWKQIPHIIIKRLYSECPLG